MHTDIRFECDLQALNAALHPNRATEKTLERLRQAHALALPLLEPKVAYQWCDVTPLDGGAFELRTDSGATARLTIGKRANLLDPAQRAVAAVSTIGPALEAEVSALNASGKYLDSYYLDCIGVEALAAATKSFTKLVEDGAAKKGWGVSLRLSPGSLDGWTFTDQTALYQLAGGLEAGVELTSSGMLKPVKSAAGLVGIGPDYTSRSVGSACRYCKLAKDCWRCKIGK